MATQRTLPPPVRIGMWLLILGNLFNAFVPLLLLAVCDWQPKMPTVIGFVSEACQAGTIALLAGMILNRS